MVETGLRVVAILILLLITAPVLWSIGQAVAYAVRRIRAQRRR